MYKNVKDLQEYIQTNDVKFLDFKMIDLKGRWRHLSIPAERLSEATMSEGIGFDASNYGYAEVKKSDMIFVPDLNTAVIDPFAKEKTMTILGDVMVIGEKENVPFDQYPRNIAKKAVEYMKESDIADEMLIAPEFEFSVFDGISYKVSAREMSHTISSHEAEEAASNEGSGFHNNKGDGYHVSLPTDSAFDLRNEICEYMGKFGIDVKYHHHEVGGSGQQEIEVELGDMLKLADDTMAAKYIIRNTAVKNGLTASLLPKPVYGEAGNGLHVHMLLKKDGKPIFYEEGKYADLSDTAMCFIGGILKHVKALCAFTNPTTNSYKRLLPGYEAPVTIGYALANRSSVIRIPSYAKTPDKKRFELRSPDATCNPYLAYSAILMAGLDGVINKINPADYNWGPFDCNLYELSEAEKKELDHLPGSLKETISELEKDHDFLLKGEVFPPELIDSWIKELKKDEEYINKIPHPAEFELYYDL